MNEEINLMNKSSNEIIDEYYKIALETKNEIEKYERVPELVRAYVENYCQLDEEDTNYMN